MSDSGGRLLLLCAALAGERPADDDWPALLPLANRLLVTPALAALFDGDSRIPRDVRQFLGVIGSRTLARNTMMRAQLEEAVAALHARGIVPLLFKGAAGLAEAAQPVAGRLFCDLDLLIADNAGDDARGALQDLGYCVLNSAGGEATFYRERDAGGIDLHCRVRSLGGRQRYADFETLSTERQLGAGVVRLPLPLLQAALVIGHDQIQERDYWRGLVDLRHLLDLRTVVTETGALDYAALARLFPGTTARRALDCQLLTLRDLFGVPLPAGCAPGPVARLQSRRRLWQMERPLSRVPLTAISLLVDPPVGAVARAQRGLPPRKRAQYVRRMFAAQKPNKA
ncbi:nucleotidyltransferase family protein [Aurantiacibacter spongiae]|uniref:nucleotidyltransferase family protein n=1 Tax=Aurantiacibacter spongiae TaxID=2488860 RepID=UPI0013155E74|nr:nucleotidyltransferase family protein [Aurantiacibacter spongiae]